MQMDRQTDRWTEGRTDRFPQALGGSLTQTTGRVCPSLTIFAAQALPVVERARGPKDQLASCSSWPHLLPSCQGPQTPHLIHTQSRRHTCTRHTPRPQRRPSLQEPADSSRDQTGGRSRAGTRMPAYCQGLCASWHTVNRRTPSM